MRACEPEIGGDTCTDHDPQNTPRNGDFFVLKYEYER